MAARQNKVDLFGAKEGASGDEKIDEEKKNYEKYIALLQNYDVLYEQESDFIKKGYYKEPLNGQIGHRELNPAWNQTKSQEYLNVKK